MYSFLCKPSQLTFLETYRVKEKNEERKMKVEHKTQTGLNERKKGRI